MDHPVATAIDRLPVHERPLMARGMKRFVRWYVANRRELDLDDFTTELRRRASECLDATYAAVWTAWADGRDAAGLTGAQVLEFVPDGTRKPA